MVIVVMGALGFAVGALLALGVVSMRHALRPRRLTVVKPRERRTPFRTDY